MCAENEALTYRGTFFRHYIPVEILAGHENPACHTTCSLHYTYTHRRYYLTASDHIVFANVNQYLCKDGWRFYSPF